jgi:hypothetical protein
VKPMQSCMWRKSPVKCAVQQYVIRRMALRHTTDENVLVFT